MNTLRPRSSRRFVAQDTSVDFAAVQTALAARFEIQLGAARRVRTVWLDTPDCRLARAGASLRDVRAGQDRTLILRLANGEQHTQTVTLRWPARADALGEGPVRQAVTPMAGIRALVPILDVRSLRTTARLLDGAQKAVVDAVIEGGERPAASSGPGDEANDTAGATSAALRIDLTAVRGYDAQLRRAERALAPLCGDPEPEGAPIVPPGAASAWLVPRRPATRFAVDAPAARALALVLLGHLDAASANVAGAIADVDTEYLHDLRVATRATRSLIKLTGDALPDQIAEEFRPRWRWVGQFTAPTRDLDVLLLALDGQDKSVDIEGINGLGPYRSWLAMRRKAEFGRLREALGSDEFAALARDWRAALERVLDEPTSGPSISELAAKRIARARKRALSQARRVDADSIDDDLHELRKRIKEMRYLQEAFGATAADSKHKSEIRALKALQDGLGRMQDTAVLLDSFDQFAASHPRAIARTTMALGALGDRQQRLRSQARAELPELLAPIADKG